MSRMLAFRQAGRALSARLGPASCVGVGVGIAALSQHPMRFDSRPVAVPARPQSQRHGSGISPKTVRQLASGSITGFGAGLVLALFSRVFYVLGSAVIFSLYVATRYGLDLPGLASIKNRVEKSALWRRGMRNPLFAASFTLTFVLAGFAHL